MNQDYLYNTSLTDLQKKMETPITELPEITKVKVGIIADDWQPKFIMDTAQIEKYEIVEIPTSEIFVKGNALSRSFSGIKFPKIEAYLRKMGYYKFTVSVQMGETK